MTLDLRVYILNTSIAAGMFLPERKRGVRQFVNHNILCWCTLKPPVFFPLPRSLSLFTNSSPMSSSANNAV